MKVSALLRAEHKVSEVANLVGVSRIIIIYAIKKCMDDGEVCDLIHFVSRTKKCKNFHSIVSLRSNFEIHNINKSFSLFVIVTRYRVS